MSYENLPVAMNCHTGIFDAGKYSIFGETERDTPSSRHHIFSCWKTVRRKKRRCRWVPSPGEAALCTQVNNSKPSTGSARPLCRRLLKILCSLSTLLKQTNE